MTTDVIHTFSADDSRARLTWDGATWRAIVIRRNPADGMLSVDLVRQTKTGRDYAASHPRGFVWMTLDNSLDRFDTGRVLAAYVREIAATCAQESEPARRCAYCGPLSPGHGDFIRPASDPTCESGTLVMQAFVPGKGDSIMIRRVTAAGSCPVYHVFYNGVWAAGPILDAEGAYRAARKLGYVPTPDNGSRGD